MKRRTFLILLALAFAGGFLVTPRLVEALPHPAQVAVGYALLVAFFGWQAKLCHDIMPELLEQARGWREALDAGETLHQVRNRKVRASWQAEEDAYFAHRREKWEQNNPDHPYPWER